MESPRVEGRFLCVTRTVPLHTGEIQKSGVTQRFSVKGSWLERGGFKASCSSTCRVQILSEDYSLGIIPPPNVPPLCEYKQPATTSWPERRANKRHQTLVLCEKKKVSSFKEKMIPRTVWIRRKSCGADFLVFLFFFFFFSAASRASTLESGRLNKLLVSMETPPTQAAVEATQMCS